MEIEAKLRESNGKENCILIVLFKHFFFKGGFGCKAPQSIITSAVRQALGWPLLRRQSLVNLSPFCFHFVFVFVFFLHLYSAIVATVEFV